MPIWCTTNYAVRGSKSELDDLIRRLNTMQQHDSEYGRYWFGNLLIDFGQTYPSIVNGLCTIYCGGVFSPNPTELSCAFGPDVDETEEFSLDEDGILRMSAITPYQRNRQMEDFLKKKYPSMEIFFYSSDEMDGFHDLYDPENLVECYPYYFSSLEGGSSLYYSWEYPRFLEDFRNECPGLEIPDDEVFLASDKFTERFEEWKNQDDSRSDIDYYVAKKVNA